ncbi:MAG: tRNA pseudouridine(38-40) synthase TruA [Pseudomonadota bacterium]
MTRFALKIEYGGMGFSGWQSQKEAPSIQGQIETALEKTLGSKVRITGAGRTDSGVHATGQVAHLDLDKDITPFRLSEALNYHLKPDLISITAAAAVGDTFHARFTATERRYLYRIIARRAPVTKDRGWVWQINNPLDIERMQSAANHLVGHHDFTTFRSTLCQAQSPVKTLDRVEVLHRRETGCDIYDFHLTARSFLHNQVRSIVGTLERVGAGSWQPKDVADALNAKSRAACGPVAPPDGLFLTDVIYPEDPFAATQVP